MIFTNSLVDNINCDSNSYYINKVYNPNILYQYINCFFTGINGKRCLYTKNKLDTVKGVLIRNQENIPDTIKVLNTSLLNSSLNIKACFLFTDCYGDRNLCHWMTEQLLVLNYLIDILELLQEKNDIIYGDYEQYEDGGEDKKKYGYMDTLVSAKEKKKLDLEKIPFTLSDLKIVINKNPRNSMYHIIREYLYKIPLLDRNNILEIDLEDGSLYQNNTCLNNKGLIIHKCLVANSIKMNLHNIIDSWNELHLRLDLISSDNKDIYSSDSHYNSPHIYMSRRNLLEPSKKTNTRILENLNSISDIICNKGYTEVFTDELKTLEERIYLFKNAKSIVCELGAGMHNLLYCSQNTEIFVLLQKNNLSWLQEYFPLFKEKEMKVTILLGETTDPNHNGNWLNTPWKLDLQELDKINTVN